MKHEESIRAHAKMSTGHSDKLEPLRPLELEKCNSVDDLVKAMKHTAFGGRNVGEAADALERMTRDKDCFKVLTLSGAMTVAKMGMVVCDMIENGMVDAVISTGALMAHGFIESAGMQHFKYRPDMDDVALFEKGYNRVYDTLEPESNFDNAYKIFRSQIIGWDSKEIACSHKINRKLGEYLHKNVKGRGILKSAYERNVPVYVPAFTDSELGLDFATIRRERRESGQPDISFDPFYDLEDYVSRIVAAKELGIFTIGGGVPRNWAQQVGPYIDLLQWRLGKGDKVNMHEETGHSKRFKYAVRICPEPVHFGGLSGCTYSEGVSWGKFVPVREGGVQVEVLDDATVAWPLIVKAVLERLKK
ncbi:putative deoxyhypusine synthase [Candidatus Bilamarchaeum dharawalense]|uniref:Putative deoxyhypusine synthase n=1 Tax=Candidatus Bilamarchaeum dharawalense TaxID=2885759 RepID=A0A5E4LQH3_9ARCH|nr:putative deoxyhypusine synthase [Candidatus Bilamarchaeum dharawalense]